MNDKQMIIKNLCRKIGDLNDDGRNGIVIQDLLRAIGLDIIYDEGRCEEYVSYKQVVELIWKLVA